MKVAVVQLNSQDDMKANLANIRTHLVEAVERHRAALVTLPEYALCLTGQKNAAAASAQDLDNSAVLDEIALLARVHDLFVHLGSVVERSPDGRFFNTSIVFDPAGRQISRYRKVHLFDPGKPEWADSVVHNEAGFLSAGETLETFEVNGVIFGHSICYDLRHPHMYQELSRTGAKVLLAPSAFTAVTGERDWEKLLRARASETGSFMLAANQCATFDQGRYRSWGHSMIVDPDGNIMQQREENPGVIAADLNIENPVEI